MAMPEFQQQPQIQGAEIQLRCELGRAQTPWQGARVTQVWVVATKLGGQTQASPVTAEWARSLRAR
eukprot:794615-Alexandrium_andersonii.AAC.1